jgi:hypothetical protein
LINRCIAAPVSPVFEESIHTSVSTSPFGHLGINLVLGGVAVSASILAAEWGLHIIKAQQSGALRRLRNDEIRKNQQSHVTDEAQREHEATQLLLALAHKMLRQFRQKASMESSNPSSCRKKPIKA